MEKQLNAIVARYNSDKTRLMDILWDVQHQFGYISQQSMTLLGNALDMSALDINETVSFYHFFLNEPCGKHTLYLCDSVIARMSGYDDVKRALEEATGCKFNQCDHDSEFGLSDTYCIGLSDQEPAMLADGVVFTRLTSKKVHDIVEQLKAGKTAKTIANEGGFESSTVEYVHSLVASNIRQKGQVFFKQGIDHKAILKSCLDISPNDVITTVTDSRIRGRGGAGFYTGLKWRLARDTEAEQRYIICNADEGEPGTFKDRVLLTNSPRDVLLGMVIAGYAAGASQGIVYLRAEYWYLKHYLEHHIDMLRSDGLVGKGILGSDFSFDLRIQMGAGAYVCGDETALIESCEGKRGTPRVKPPFPTQIGYLGKPTVVNNVETLASVTRIMEMGAEWFSNMGTKDSSGARLLSVSGDCKYPGIYEITWGTSLNEVLKLVGAEGPYAVQVGGPSGYCVSVEKDGDRVFCYSDLACNGSLMIFDETRDILGLIRHFTQFFVDESCGICTPCRAGGVAILDKVNRIIAGRATQKDLKDCENWGQLMWNTSRCGLGTTAACPVHTSMNSFPEVYAGKLNREDDTLIASFDYEQAVAQYDDIAERINQGSRS